jgi:cytochrome c-type biogenesis protein CcmH/NrfG
MLDAVRLRPRDAAAWTNLGNAYVANDAGQMSPAARFAFAQALRLAPTEAGPPFFLGMGLAAGGDFAGARDAWTLALARTPAKAPYREDIKLRLGMVEVFLKRGMVPR